jgi:PPP family 3-phenylpropionic acid transporter
MFFVSAATPLLESLLVKYANDNKVNYGAIRLWGEVGVGTTTLVIGFVLQYYGMRYLGWMYGLLLLGGLLLLLRTPDAQREAKPITMQSFAKLFSNRTFLLYLIIILLVSIPHRMNDSYLMIYLAQLGATGTIAGLGWTVSATGSMISLLFLSKLMDKYDEIRFVIIACICYAIRWLIYGLAEHSGFVIAGQALHMATFSVFLVASTRYIYRIVPKELIATAITLYLAIFMGLGGIIGGVAGGWMIDHTGPHAAYLLGCMLSAAAAGLAIAYRSRLIKE